MKTLRSPSGHSHRRGGKGISGGREAGNWGSKRGQVRNVNRRGTDNERKGEMERGPQKFLALATTQRKEKARREKTA